MSSEGGIMPSNKNPSSGAASDDEISVIAVIKKGTSGIPKRARYHYIRELPLNFVKPSKKPFQKSNKDSRRNQGRVSILGIKNSSKNSSTEEKLRVINSAKKPRVIELGDQISKMELRKQFKMAENNNEEEEEEGEQFHNAAGISSSSTPRENNVVHKLPPGTVLIKQEPKTPKFGIQHDNSNVLNPPELNDGRSNTNGSSAGASSATTTTSASSSNTNSSGSNSASSISSCGSGSSSGGFGSGSPSRLGKVKRLHRGSKGGSRKKIVEVVPRRNPKRSGSKKITTIAEVAIPTTTTTMTTRPRQRRLLATRRQERIGGTTQTVTNRRTKPTTMPYMNTRSVTRKLYTVGATYQAPTRKDETEWRDWPVHGMHERPVFHPQVGIAAGYAERVFWSTTDTGGSNWTYREILDAPEEVEIVPVDPSANGTQSTPPQIKNALKPPGESFEVCMHDSLHTVLAYCAQVMAPGYRKMVEKKGRHDLDAQDKFADEFSRQKNADVEFLDKESTHLNLSQLEDSSISDETLMEMSSIYKKLLPIEDQPSSRDGSPSSSPPGNNYTIRKTAEGCSKNSNEASEIARILSEYNESLKEANLSRPFTSTIPVTALCTGVPKEGKDSGETKVQQKTLMTGRTIVVNDGAKVAQDTEINDDHWLEELLVDTSLLYCVATGVGQYDLTKYVDNLDAKQSLQWLQSGNG